MMFSNSIKSQHLALYWFFLREFYRSRAFSVMLVLIVGIATLITLLTYFERNEIFSLIAPTPEPFSHMSPQLRSLFLNYVWSYIGVIIPPLAASFYSSPAISGDFENGTVIPLLTLPVSRGNLLFSKLFSSFTAIALTISLYELIQLVVVEILAPSSSLSLFYLSYALMLLFIFSCNSLAFAVGSFFRKSSHSTIIFLMLFYVVFNVISIALLLGFNSMPLYILNNAGVVVAGIFVNLNPILFFGGGTISGATSSQVLYAAETMLLYSLVFTLLSYIGFTRSRRDI